MESVAHVIDEKEELSNDLYRLAYLGVYFLDMYNEGMMIKKV